MVESKDEDELDIRMPTESIQVSNTIEYEPDDLEEQEFEIFQIDQKEQVR